jgi:ribosomal protein S18 acetylase RimI-like enzyme
MRMNLRRATSADVPDIAIVNVDTFQATQRGIVPDSVLKNLDVGKAADRFQRLLSRDDLQAFIYVAEVNGAVIGYAMAGLAREHVPGYIGELYGIYILPPYHRSGIGRQLVQAVANELMHAGVPSMYVLVFKENTRARRFYESLGGQFLFERTITLGDEDVPEVGYGWRTLIEFGTYQG